MRLPDDQIGISDILGWRECARRMSFGMRRWTQAGAHPEAATVHTAYGSALHDAVAYAEERDASDDDAIQHAFDKHGRWLEPDDLPRIKADMETYRRRDYLGVRTIAVEKEFRVPLMEWEGRTIYFRFRLDRLYQSLRDESVFVAIDYKTSRWPKAEEEVHADPQMWAYNFGIHEVFPECATLVQVYDQLRHGAIPTRKSDSQREQMREWLRRQTTAILRDEDYQDDGFLAPTKNEWCAYCPIMESCSIVPQLTDFALAEIAALAPEHRNGRSTIVDLDPARLDDYVAKLEAAGQARKVLERYEGAVKNLLLRTPQSRRDALGYKVRERRVDHWPAETLRVAHEVMGDDLFYEAVGLTKAAIERVPDERARQFLLDLAEKKVGSTYIQKR